jgi:hypothetical protein
LNSSTELVEGKLFLIRYFPAAPVQCSTSVGGGYTNGGAEAWVELAKATNTLGDFRLSIPTNASNWAVGKYVYDDPTSASIIYLPEYDGRYAITSFNKQGAATAVEVEAPVFSSAVGTTIANNFYGGRALSGAASCAFAMAQSLETSNGMEISGLNAEEQSDITLTSRWTKAQGDSPLTNMVFFVYYDAMLVLYENNVLQLIE